MSTVPIAIPAGAETALRQDEDGEGSALRSLGRAYAAAPWLPILVGWLCFDLVQGYLKQFLDHAFIGWPPPFRSAALHTLLEAVLWTLVTPAAWWVARRAPLGPKRWAAPLAANLAAGVALAAVVVVVRWRVVAWAGVWHYPLPRTVADALLAEFWQYVLLATVAYGVLYARLAHERALQSARLESEIGVARLRALQSQIEPHFLYNTLNSIAELVHDDVPAAQRMAARLGELFEGALKSPGAQEVPLGDELAFVEAYCDIQRTRFCDRLTVRIRVSDAVKGAIVPRFVLQPLVENAIRHGIAPRAAAGTVHVAAERAGDVLRLEVRDDGVGSPDGEPFSEGVGLGNTRARLRGLYGPAHRLDVDTGARGTRVRVELPYRTG